MSTSLAQLNDRVYMDMQIAGEFLQLDQVHNAVVQTHNIFIAEARTSTTNVLLGVSPTFTPTDTKVDVTAYIGKGEPAFLEMLDDQQKWQTIRIVSLQQLHDYYLLGVMAASFYGEESGDPAASAVRVDPVQYVEFSYMPTTACRIRFDRDSVRIGVGESSEMPDHVSELIVKTVENTLIPRMKLAMDFRCRNDKEFREIVRDVKSSLSELAAQNAIDIQPLKDLWRVWKYKDRAASSGSFNKPTPSSRGVYGIGVA